MIVLLHLFDLTPGALDFEMAHQTLRAVAIVGGEGLPAIDGHAAQGTVGTFAKALLRSALAMTCASARRTPPSCNWSNTFATTSALKAFTSGVGLRPINFWKSLSWRSPSKALRLGMRNRAEWRRLLTTSKVEISGARRVSFKLANSAGKAKTLQAYFSNW